MVKKSRRSYTRGRVAYVFPKVEAFHIEQLRRFLSVVYADYRSKLHLCVDLLPLIFDKAPEEIERILPDGAYKIFPDWDLEECLRWQESLREQFGRMIQGAKTKKGYRLEVDPHLFLVEQWGDEGEVFQLQPHWEFSSKDQELVMLILRNVAGHMHGLKREALKRCQLNGCGRYFLDADLRDAEYCSQPCRYRAYDEQRERPARKKSRKRG